MAEQRKDRTGQQLGNYRLVRFLGQGGFAEVYLGQHIFLQTQAAIKILRTQLTPGEQEAFLQEARTIAHLVHAHIVRVFDFGTQDNLPFLVMDYAPNGSLRERHPRGTRVAPQTVVDYIKQIASALQYAHDEKLIHRDVKPENMLVGRHGEVLLSDFGISVVAHSTHSQSTQEVVGSVPYMAPEQLQGKPRPASDQYALGIVAYEWLCGERPFHGSFTEISGQHVFAPPPSLRAKNPLLSPEIESVIMTALAKDAHRRFATIQAFANALEQAYRSSPFAIQTERAQSLAPTAHAQPFASTEPAQASTSAPLVQTMTAPPARPAEFQPLRKQETVRRPSRRAILAGLGALAVVGAGGGTAWYLLAPHYPPQGTLIYTYPAHGDKVLAVAWHGTRIASGGVDMTAQVWDATTGGNPRVYRNHTSQVNTIAWSPDGQRIVTGSDDGTAQVWSASSAALLVKYTGHQHAFGNVHSVAWSPDGQYIASGGTDGTVQIWNASNGKPIYTYTGHKGGFTSVNSVAWSPDGSRIASGASDNTVQVWDALTGKHAYKYQGHQSSVNSVVWSPNGSQIASGGDDHTLQVWQPSSQGQTLVYTKHTDNITSIAWSPDAQYLASASADKTVHIWRPESTAPQPYIFAPPNSGSANAVTWSDDSHRLVSGHDDKLVRVWEGV